MCSNIVKHQLFRAFKLGGVAGYTSALSEAQCGSSNVFIPTQEQIKTMQAAMNILLETGERGESETDCLM